MANRRTCQKSHILKPKQQILRRMTHHFADDGSNASDSPGGQSGLHEIQRAGQPFVFFLGDRSPQFKWALRTGYPMIIVTEPVDEVIVPIPFGSGTHQELKQSKQLCIAGGPNDDPELWPFPWQKARPDALAADTVDEFVKLFRL